MKVSSVWAEVHICESEKVLCFMGKCERASANFSVEWRSNHIKSIFVLTGNSDTFGHKLWAEIERFWQPLSSTLAVASSFISWFWLVFFSLRTEDMYDMLLCVRMGKKMKILHKTVQYFTDMRISGRRVCVVEPLWRVVAPVEFGKWGGWKLKAAQRWDSAKWEWVFLSLVRRSSAKSVYFFLSLFYQLCDDTRAAECASFGKRIYQNDDWSVSLKQQ